MRRKLLAVVLAAFVFSFVAASAASLGGINTAALGADSEIVAACDSDGVNVGYNFTYSPGAPGFFEVTSVDVSAIAAPCDNLAIEVTLSDGATQLGSGTVGDIGTSGSVNVPVSAGVSGEDVTEIGIVITG